MGSSHRAGYQTSRGHTYPDMEPHLLRLAKTLANMISLLLVVQHFLTNLPPLPINTYIRWHVVLCHGTPQNIRVSEMTEHHPGQAKCFPGKTTNPKTNMRSLARQMNHLEQPYRNTYYDYHVYWGFPSKICSTKLIPISWSEILTSLVILSNLTYKLHVIEIFLQNSVLMLYISTVADNDPKCSCRWTSSYKKELYRCREIFFTQ